MRGLNVRLMLTQVMRRCVVQDALKRSERLLMHRPICLSLDARSERTRLPWPKVNVGK